MAPTDCPGRVKTAAPAGFCGAMAAMAAPARVPPKPVPGGPGATVAPPGCSETAAPVAPAGPPTAPSLAATAVRVEPAGCSSATGERAVWARFPCPPPRAAPEAGAVTPSDCLAAEAPVATAAPV